MPRKPNYNFEKRQKELARKQKRDAKANDKRERKDAERLVADQGDDHEIAKLRGMVDEITLFWGPDRLLQAATVLREKADDLECRAQQLRGGDGARQVAALLDRAQRMTDPSYIRAYWKGHVPSHEPEDGVVIATLLTQPDSLEESTA